MDKYFGFLLIDKPKGITSHDAVSEVKRKLNCKVGHTGTLDPFATGLLVMALGKATRLADYVQKQEKEYEVEMILGEERDSYDVTGEVVERHEVVDVTEEKIISILGKFKGEILQRPPVYSAIKVGGERAYKRVRRGELVEIKERPVKIFDIELLSIDLPSVKFKVRCSTGTYIRSLVHDIGVELGSLAYAKDLRRTVVGKFSVSNALTLEQMHDLTQEEIKSRMIQPLDALSDYSQVILNDQQYDDISHGREVICPAEFQDLEFAIAVFKNQLSALVNIVEKGEQFILKPDKVFVREE